MRRKEQREEEDDDDDDGGGSGDCWGRGRPSGIGLFVGECTVTDGQSPSSWLM